MIQILTSFAFVLGMLSLVLAIPFSMLHLIEEECERLEHIADEMEKDDEA